MQVASLEVVYISRFGEQAGGAKAGSYQRSTSGESDYVAESKCPDFTVLADLLFRRDRRKSASAEGRRHPHFIQVRRALRGRLPESP